MPVEPPPTSWIFPDPEGADESGVVGVGADIEPGTLLAAYRSGLFPMPVGNRMIGWWSPDPRGVIPVDGLRVSRSMRQSARRYEIRIDTSFREVMIACGDPSRPHGWINNHIVNAYTRLHELGWAHSVETWHDDELVGGLYGVAIGGLFAGESMFHRASDASKVALMGLIDLLDDHDATLLDCQWTTDHLATLGAIDLPRRDYLERLTTAITRPLPKTFA